jgi:uncharacterized protein YehS (DUF1456 family)
MGSFKALQYWLRKIAVQGGVHNHFVFWFREATEAGQQKCVRNDTKEVLNGILFSRHVMSHD